MTLPDFAPVILVIPSMAALRTAFGVRINSDGSVDSDDYGQVPNLPWWGRSHTPLIWKMSAPGVRDATSTKAALVAVMNTAEALALKARFPANVFAYRPSGLANAQAAHPELDWASLGEVWGWSLS